MEIIHSKDNHIAYTNIDGHTAYIKYEIHDKNLNILETIVPEELSGKGIASQLVQFIYNYSQDNHYNLSASCPYAHAWLLKKYGKERIPS